MILDVFVAFLYSALSKLITWNPVIPTFAGFGTHPPTFGNTAGISKDDVNIKHENSVKLIWNNMEEPHVLWHFRFSTFNAVSVTCFVIELILKPLSCR